MSGDDEGRRDAESDRIDALISAAMDDELDAAGREELDRLVAAEPELAARVRAFHRVDAGLRTIGADGFDAARVAEGVEALRVRLAEASDEAPEVAALDDRRAGGTPIVRWVLAAAAALLLYLAFAGGPDPADTPSLADAPDSADAPTIPGPTDAAEAPALARGPDPVGDAVDLAEEAADVLVTDEELAVVLGYVEGPADLSPVPGIAAGDLEIIEELEVLEYLAAREAEGRG